MIRRLLRTVAAGSALVAVAGTAAPRAGAEAPAERTGRLVVLAEPDAPQAAVARAAGGRAAGPAVPEIGVATVRPRRGESLAAAARRIAAQPGVARVEREGRMRLREVPDDPALLLPEPVAGTATSPLPADTRLAWPLLRSGFPGAWDVTRGERALVAVIDTGVEATHPELAPKLERLADQQAPALSTGPAGIDVEGHGTHVASLACAATGNGLGSAGAGHDCRLLVEKTDLTDASIAAAIVDAADHGAHAINMSFGDDGSRPASAAIRRALRYAAARDVVLVAAAADEPVREQGDPANVLQPTGSGPRLEEGIGLSVTAATYAGERAAFAGRGSQISLAAYGAAGIAGSGPPGILGAFPTAVTPFEQRGHGCGCRTALAGDARYGYLAGTSMAAPQVAAAAALVRTLNPDLSGREVVQLLKRTASREPGVGWSTELGWGILDAERALAAARMADRRSPASELTSVVGARGGAVRVTWSAADRAPEGVVAAGLRGVELVVVRLPERRVQRLRLPLRSGTGRFRGESGARYALWTSARDRAGNREARPQRPDALVRVPG